MVPAGKQPRSIPWLQLVVVALGCFALARLGLLFTTVNGHASPVWPATGLGLAALLLGGPRLWPAVGIAVFAATLLNKGTVFVASLQAAGSTLEALVGAALMRRFALRDGRFEHYKDLVVLISASIVACAISATIGIASIVINGTIQRAEASHAWMTWWVGDLLGALEAYGSRVRALNASRLR